MKSIGLVVQKPIEHITHFDQNASEWREDIYFGGIIGTPPIASQFTNKSEFDAIIGAYSAQGESVVAMTACTNTSTSTNAADNECGSSVGQMHLRIIDKAILTLEESVQVVKDLHQASRHSACTYIQMSASSPDMGATSSGKQRNEMEPLKLPFVRDGHYFACIRKIGEEVASEAQDQPLFSLLPPSAHHALLCAEENMICGIT